MRGLPLAVAGAVALLGCNDGRPPLVGSAVDGQCPPGKSATFDRLGGRTYVCQDEQLVLFVTCVERVTALTGVSADSYGGLLRARADATAACARFTENRTEKPCADPPARVQAALPARYEPPSPMSDSNPYGDPQGR